MGARVILVHAVEWLAEVEPADDVDFDVAGFRARLVYNGQRRLDALIADELTLDRTVRARVVTGRSYRQLLTTAAAERADLIVVGSDGRGGTMLPLLGSTVEQIVRAAPCPALTIRLPHERLSNGPHPMTTRERDRELVNHCAHETW
jgi:nucleotide-binding universal stress UspA family protein